MTIRLLRDYRETLRGEVNLGAPNTLATRLLAFLWALRRSRGLLGSLAGILLRFEGSLTSQKPDRALSKDVS